MVKIYFANTKAGDVSDDSVSFAVGENPGSRSGTSWFGARICMGYVQLHRDRHAIAIQAQQIQHHPNKDLKTDSDSAGEFSNPELLLKSRKESLRELLGQTKVLFFDYFFSWTRC